MTIHVVGAGLAGLSAAVTAARAGARVVVHEAAPQAGGRCRSFPDPALGAPLDNGTHLVLSGNRSLRAYLRKTGAEDLMVPLPPEFPFLDLASGRQWVVRPAAWWRHLDVLRLAVAGKDAAVVDVLGACRDYEPLWAPLTLAVLNTRPDEASPRLLWRVAAETLLRGAGASRPMIPRATLSAALVEPAVRTLRARGARIAFRHPLRALRDDGRGLVFDDGEVALGAGDALVLALPPWAASRLAPFLPDLPCRGILNAHFRVEVPAGKPRLLGLLGADLQWLFAREGLVSATISAADDRLMAAAADDLGPALWRQAATALALAEHPVPPFRIVKERRATIAQTPATDALRPGPATPWPGVFLAGDWTATGLPCTLEGAVRSGEAAARLALRNAG